MFQKSQYSAEEWPPQRTQCLFLAEAAVVVQRNYLVDLDPLESLEPSPLEAAEWSIRMRELGRLHSNYWLFQGEEV